ncbi:SURF1 family protein, partial [Necator americanus]
IPATTFGLGCWQTYRLRWKLDLIERLKLRLNEAAIDFPVDDISKLENMEYQRVRLSGEFLHEREFYISPRGRFDPGHEEKSTGSLLSSDNLSSHGAHIITPFRLSNSNLVVMINRGWVPASKISPNSRSSSQPKGEVTIEAVVRKSEKRPQFVGENVPEKGLWFYKNFAQMAKQYNTDPIYLEAVYESTVPGGPIGGQSNVNVRNDHLSYLLTWFSLSAITLAMWSEELYPEDWTDPNDPTHGHLSSVTAEIARGGKDVRTCEEYDPTLRLILREMFRELNVDPSEKAFFSRLAKISLSSINMKIIGSYLEKETLENELVMREQYNEDSSVSAWQEVLTMAQPWISVLNMMILPPALFFVLKNVMGSRSLLSCIVLVFFIVSMITTYNRMYQEKLAQRMAEAMSRKEDACAANSLLEQSLEYLSSFLFFRKKSSCVSFIESQTVSIVAEISLLDVFSDVLSNSVFGILGNLGRHTNRFFREFYENVPLPAMLLMTVTLPLLSGLCAPGSCFKAGNKKLEDEPRSGRPTAISFDELKNQAEQHSHEEVETHSVTEDRIRTRQSQVVRWTDHYPVRAQWILLSVWLQIVLEAHQDDGEL